MGKFSRAKLSKPLDLEVSSERHSAGGCLIPDLHLHLYDVSDTSTTVSVSHRLSRVLAE